MRSRVLIACVVAVVAVVAGLATYEVIGRGPTGSSVIDDGPTFYSALAALNVSAESIPGGPWNFSAAYGIASPIPVSPASWGYGPYDQAFASCQAEFNGLTLWNGSFPLFTGSFDSGTAPFWQFVYFSNNSDSLLIGTDLEGQTHIYPAISMNSTCGRFSGLSYEPWREEYDSYVSGFPGNTPVMASDAWRVFGQQWVGWARRPVAEMYLFGGFQFGSGQAAAEAQLQFFTCGTPGAAGVTLGLAVYGSSVQSPNLGDNWNYSLGCTPTTDEFTPISLTMNFTANSQGGIPQGSLYSQKIDFYDTGPAGYVGPGFNTRGITTSLIRLELYAANGSEVPLGSPACPAWVPSLDDCAANASGWYAVLSFPSGQWAGAYGSLSGGPGWSYSAVPVLNNESISVVAPSSWNVSGGRLVISSAATGLQLMAQSILA